MEVELTRHNVLSRGYTPPPEEKVAFYVYNQTKVAADRPPSVSDTVLRAYSNEPVAWTPELPADWTSNQVVDRQPSQPALTPHNQSSASLARLAGPRPLRNSPDRDFADLEAEIMGGTEVDYGGVGRQDARSDIQEMSMGNQTPQARPIALADDKSVRSAVPRSVAHRRDGSGSAVGNIMFGNTPALAASVPLPEGSVAPGTPKTTGIHIQIQPPTDPAMSKAPSRAPSRAQGRAAPSVTGTYTSRRREPSPERQATVVPVPQSPRSTIGRTTQSFAPFNSMPHPNTSQPIPGGGRTSPGQPPVTDGRGSQLASQASKRKSKQKGPKMGPVSVETKYNPSGFVESVTVKMQEMPSNRDSMMTDLTDAPSAVHDRQPTIHELPEPSERSHNLARSAMGRSARDAPSARAASVPPGSPTGERPLHPLTGIIRSQAGSPSPTQQTHHTQRSHAPSSRPGGMQHVDGLGPRGSHLNGAHGRHRSHEHDLDDMKSVSQQLEALERMDLTPTPSRSQSPQNQLQRLTAQDAIDAIRTPRTSYTVSPSVLAAEVNKSHFHDEDLCVLLHAADDTTMPDAVRKAVRRAVRSRLKKLGVESEEQYRKAHMSKGKHSHGVNYRASSTVAPEWARPLFELLENAQARLDSLDHRIDSSRGGSQHGHLIEAGHDDEDYEHDEHGLIDDGPSVDYEHASHAETPRTGNITMPVPHIEPPAPGGTARSIPLSATPRGFGRHERHGAGGSTVTGDGIDHHQHHHQHHHHHGQGYDGDGDDDDFEEFDEHQLDNDASLAEDIEEEVFRLQQRGGSHAASSHHGERPLPEIPGSENEDDHRATTPTRRAPGPEPPTTSLEITPSTNGPAFARPPGDGQLWIAPPSSAIDWNRAQIPSWQRVHQRLLSWAIVWSMSELERSLESTEKGHQVDECALTIWTTQCYKRYVRSKTADNPRQKVDRLFVPPNVADAINSAVYNGRHGDACSMLKDMWAPFGFEGMPRLLIVLARHRRDANHWVVHRFSIPEGTLSTYDTYPERSLADGRPLGWWFAIRAAWPHAGYPNPDHLVQKLVRIHRPMQLLIDNSVAAAAIWRNLLMGSKAERSVDLLRMRDLISTEVRALKTRKDQGKLALPATRGGGWEESVHD